MKQPVDISEAALREAIRRIVEPIVVGQLRATRFEHPESLSVVGARSAAKRIINDLISRDSTLRLMAVFLGAKLEESSASTVPVGPLAVVHRCGERVTGGSIE